MPKINIKVHIQNEEEDRKEILVAILQENILKYKEKDRTTVTFNYDTNTLRRRNKDMELNYVFLENIKTEGIIQIKEIHQEMTIPIRTKKINRKGNDLEIYYEINHKPFLYQIEEIK